jgi:hypothetical protein
MASNPIVLAVRFLLELGALYAYAYWGWTQHTGIPKFIWTIGVPLVAAILWGTFRVPGEIGKVPVAVPGILRLLIEILVFGGAVWAFYAAGRSSWGLIFGIIVILHYIASYDYVLRLLRTR